MNVHYVGDPPMRVLELMLPDGSMAPCVYPIVQDDQGWPLVLEHRFDVRHPVLGLQAAWWFGFDPSFSTCEYAGASELPADTLRSTVLPALLRAIEQESA